MSYNIKNDTITVNDITYDVEEAVDGDGDNCLCVSLDGDDAFPGLEGIIGYEREDASMFNPRDWTNIGTMSVSYNRYNLGDEDISKIDFTLPCGNCEGEGTVAGNPDNGEDDEIECPICGGLGERPSNPMDYFKQKRGARVVLPLSVYEHSGITMFVGHHDHMQDPGGWDTSYVGFIFDTPESVKECFGDNATDEQIEAALRSEVKVYADYLEGNILWWSVKDSETNLLDSTGGYVGDEEQCKSDCYTALEHAIEKRLAENKERADMAARDIITEV